MSWYQEFDGGRSFYTAMGNTDETFSEDLFLNHLYAGINYAMGGDNPHPLNYDKARPEENRFAKRKRYHHDCVGRTGTTERRYPDEVNDGRVRFPR